MPETVTNVAVPPELIKRIQALARSNTRTGFLWHYHVLALLPLPDHAIPWVHEYFNAVANGEDLAVEAFRGSLKTTMFSGYMTSYQIANHPELETAIIQANDPVARENTDWLSSLIEDSPGWKFLYPHIQPDNRRWGAEGYEVKRNDMTYGEWRALRTKTPSFVGAGYKSDIVQGKHPRLHVIRDDVNTPKNTRSARLMTEVEDAVFKVQKPASESAKMEIDVFTPWVEGDIGDLRKKTPRVRVIRTPITKDGTLEGEPTWPGHPEFGDPKALSETMPWATFALAYLLNRTAIQGTVLKTGWLHEFDHKEVNVDITEGSRRLVFWPIYIGVDYASIESRQAKKGRDFFSLTVLALHPNNFLVYIDGYRGQVTRPEAEQIAIEWGNKYNTHGELRVMSIENLGKGEEYANWMLGNAPFHVKPQGVKNKPKGERYEIEMAPLFRSGLIRISNTDLEPAVSHITTFRHEWASWSGDEGASHTDTLDSMYHAILGARFRIKPRQEGHQQDRQQQKKKNIYQAFVS